MHGICFRVVGLTVLLVLIPCADAGADLAASCKNAKAKAAGKKADELLKAFANNLRAASPLRLAFDVSKAQSKFTKTFTKAEGTGGCTTTNDAGTTEAKVDAFVDDVVGICDCCAGAGLLSFEAAVGFAPIGTVRNFRCTGPLGGDACAADTDCDFGPCLDEPDPMPDRCAQDPNVECTGDADCTGTCAELMAFGLPLTLTSNAMYAGGGGYELPMQPAVWPFKISDTTTIVAKVASCNAGALTLGSTTAVESGSVFSCTSPGCSFAAPLPASGHCAVFRFAGHATGTATCRGEVELTLPLEMDLYFTPDLTPDVVNPGDIPGFQFCPLCVRQCSGGSNDGFPCQDDGDCPGGTCGGATECLGGMSDGAACTPNSADLGLGFPVSYFLGYPTSHDCLPDADALTTSNGPALVNMTLTTADVTKNAVDLDSAGPGAQRVFCGNCRDVNGSGSLCYDGDPESDCPDSAAQPSCHPQPPVDTSGCGTAIACVDDSDCTAPYESCRQRTSGAFGRGAATQIAVNGSPAMCLAGGEAQAADLVSVFCVPTTFSTGGSSVDNTFDLPGPGVLTLKGSVKLLPP